MQSTDPSDVFDFRFVCDDNAELVKQDPPAVWRWFAALCRVPRPSRAEGDLARRIVLWAKSKNLSVKQDAAGNVVVVKPATKGYENKATVALQAHLDMVCQARVDFDFLRDPICPVVDGRWVRAQGTTLGADNGIGAASVLAILESDDLAHPKIEALFTVAEEVGMEGAKALAADALSADFIINVDAETLGDVYLGCAGGEEIQARFFAPLKSVPKEAAVFEYRLGGFKGGHSGLDIDKGGANALKTLAYALVDAPFSLYLLDFFGGSAKNAIAREATAVFAVLPKDADAAAAALQQKSRQIGAWLGKSEPAFFWSVERISNQSRAAFGKADSARFLNFVNALPNGVLRRSSDLAGAVETSLNVGVARMGEEGAVLDILARSLSDQGLRAAKAAAQSVCDLAGVDVGCYGGYAPWPFGGVSDFACALGEAYRKAGCAPAFKAMHAGLECGVLARLYPKARIASVGPTIENAHSPDERVHIDSVARFWRFLLTALAECAWEKA